MPTHYTLIDTVQIEKTDFAESHKAFLVLCGKKQFYCGGLVSQLIDLLATEKSITAITNSLATTYPNYEFTEEKVTQIIEQKIIPLGIIKQDKAVQSDLLEYDEVSSVKVRRTLISSPLATRFARIFRFAYQRPLAILLLILGLVAHIFHFQHHAFLHQHIKIWSEASAAEYMLIYAIIIGAFLFHELGHATAAYHYGIKVPAIGYGFYLVYPVFFTEISEAWKLKPRKRMVINLGGIYFQWILNIFFIALAYLYPDTLLWQGLVFINFSRLVYSFLPFMKADGYWIFSDGFGIRNLRQKSNQFLFVILKEWSWKKAKTIVDTTTQRIALATYSVGMLIFFGFWFTFLSVVIWKFAPMLPPVLVSFYQTWLIGDFALKAKITLQTFLLGITLFGIGIFFVRIAAILRFVLQKLTEKTVLEVEQS